MKSTCPRSTLSIRRHIPDPHHLSSNFITSMSQSSHQLACSNCNNWAYACVCGAQGDALFMTPVSYYHYHHLPSSDYNDYNSSHSNFASGSGTSLSPIPLAQGHSNHSQFFNLTHSTVNNQPAVTQPFSSGTQEHKATQNTLGASSSKQPQARKENTSPNTPTSTRSSPCPAVPGAGPSSRPVNSHHVESILLCIKHHMLNVRLKDQHLRPSTKVQHLMPGGLFSPMTQMKNHLSHHHPFQIAVEAELSTRQATLAVFCVHG